MKKLVRTAKRAENDNSIDIEKLSPGLNEDDPYNSFYDTASVIFRVISFALFGSLLVFIVSSAFISARSFSYDNLDYIMRNFALTLEENKESVRQPIRYSPDSLKGFAVYGNGLAVCRASGISVFSGTGRQTCSEFIDFSEPVISASEKYVIVFEQGSGRYSVYNAFSKTYSSECDKTIRGCAIADNGYYAFVTSSDEYASVVEVYNDDFNLITRFNKNAHVISIDLTDDSIMIVSVSVGGSNTSFDTEILIADPDSGDLISKTKQSSGFPLGCKITEYGYAVVCSDSVWLYDNNANALGTFEYEGLTLNDFRISESHTLLLFKSKGFEISYTAVCIDKRGNIAYKYELTDTVFDIDVCSSSSYILTSGYVLCLNGSLEERLKVDSAHYGCKLLALDSGSFYYCSDTAAELIECSW
jgi:hypothetical protein